jgi:acetyl esterase/lipase
MHAQAPAQSPSTSKPNPNAEPETFPLWPDGAPGALGKEDADRPTVTLFRARQPSGASIVVAPGGGYGALASNHEGRQVANYLNAAGITVFVLKYRLGPKYRHPIELGDAQRAIRLVRSRAQEFSIVPDRIGFMGFSAGGHLAATAGTHFDGGNASSSDPIERVSSRPDYLVLAYPVVSFTPAIAHAGSVRNLLGDSPPPALIEELSNEKHVTAQTPPTFLFHTTADAAVPVENSIEFYLAARKAKVPVEMHIFENGPHGVGLAMNDPALSEWPTLLMNWLRARGLLTKP